MKIAVPNYNATVSYYDKYLKNTAVKWQNLYYYNNIK